MFGAGARRRYCVYAIVSAIRIKTSQELTQYQISAVSTSSHTSRATCEPNEGRVQAGAESIVHAQCSPRHARVRTSDMAPANQAVPDVQVLEQLERRRGGGEPHRVLQVALLWAAFL